MTLQQYIKHLENSIVQIKQEAKCFVPIVNHVLVMQQTRIFDNGKDFKGGDIGKYGTNPLYVNPNAPGNPRRFPVKGKYGQSEFNNGKPHKTGYFENYATYKKEVGRKGDPVNLHLKGSFRRAFVNPSNVAASIDQQITNDAIILYTGVNISAANPQGKVEGLLKKYPQAFKWSQTEKDYFNSRVNQCLMNKVRG